MRMTKVYVYSTLTSDQEYRTFRESGGDLPQVEASVLIRGKANVMDKHFVTPAGMLTEITEDQLAVLERCEVFRLHVKHGHIIVSRDLLPVEKVVGDLEARDKSAPLTEASVKGQVDDVVINKTAKAKPKE